MGRKIVLAAAIVLLAICLASGGCSTFAGDNSLKAWKELLSLSPEAETADDNSGTSLEDLLLDQQLKPQDTTEYIVLSLYYGDRTGNSLVSEERQIEKTEGIARRTLQELLKGPENTDYISLFPEGTRLLDINIKEDGWCIVDLSSEVRQIKDEQQEQLMIDSLTNTLGQFPTVRRISFMIDGQTVDYLGGYVDLAQPLEAHYK